MQIILVERPRGVEWFGLEWFGCPAQRKVGAVQLLQHFLALWGPDGLEVVRGKLLGGKIESGPQGGWDPVDRAI